MSIADNVRRLREEISEAAVQSGRSGTDICLVAATKTQTAETVRQAVAAGVDACGENRVQELIEKSAARAYTGTNLHFIGHLQKNKVRKVVGAVSLIQSVDSPELLGAIDRVAGELDLVQEVLIQVNIGHDPGKFGIDPPELEALLEQAAQFAHIRVKGLMTILPILTNPIETRRLFAKMYQVYVDIRRKKHHNTDMAILSMGMSADFQDAILEGANMIRVGSHIFGHRD